MRKADLNSVKAGEYEIVAVYWDEIKSKPGQPFDYLRHRRGETVTLNVEQARRLLYAGAVVKPGETDEVEQPGQTTSLRPGVPAEEQERPAESAKVKDILERVGSDKTLAAAALEHEKAKGDDARPTLVEKLEEILTDPAGGGQ